MVFYGGPGVKRLNLRSAIEYYVNFRYPPKAGNFFSSHFIMGGEKFDSPQPESFLFGENSGIQQFIYSFSI